MNDPKTPNEIKPYENEELEDIHAGEYATASRGRLIWWRFRKHRLAMVGGVVLIMLYLAAAFAEFVAPFKPTTRNADFIYAPPQRIHFFDRDGNFSLRPFTYPLIADKESRLGRDYRRDYSNPQPLQFFARTGDPYRMWGLFESDRRLFSAQDTPFFLFGTDSLGRDLFSRIVYGARISLTIGLIGVSLTFMLGVLLGGLAGYLGGITDNVVQRLIEILMSIPSLPLWMILSASLPMHWSPITVYFGITVILSFLGWTGLAREVRGKFLSIRDEDFVVAARLCGTNELSIITRHLLPSFMSHIIARATLAIPSMILGETALSFLGIGLRAPVISWGVLLEPAQNYEVVAMYPWLLMPALFIIIVVLAFNMIGDGLRDAADPYST